MKTFFSWIVIIILVVVTGALWYWQSHAPAPQGPGQTATTTTSGNTAAQTTSDGTITFATPANFALATTPEQVLVKSYIPPCEQDFNYCLYYNSSDYAGTNFESAGLTIKNRADFSTQAACLNTPPDGFAATTKPNNTFSTNTYSASVFSNVGDAAAGHYSSGALYRLFVSSNSKCYEFLLRIGETQFANYPAGAIKQFTDAGRATMEQTLVGVLNSITFADGSAITFPSTK